MMRIADIIRKRRSVRTFDGNGLSEESLQHIFACAEGSENPYGIPVTWKILSAKRKKPYLQTSAAERLSYAVFWQNSPDI